MSLKKITKKRFFYRAILLNLGFVVLAFIATIPALHIIGLIIVVPLMVFIYASPLILGIYVFLIVKTILNKNNRLYTGILISIGLICFYFAIRIYSKGFDVEPSTISESWSSLIETVILVSGIFSFGAVPLEIYFLSKYGD